MTDFIETNALLAIMEDDEEKAVRLLADLLPGERLVFRTQVERLAVLVAEACAARHRGATR